MKKTLPITALFVDIGGVLLTNGWSHESRKQATKIFSLDLDEMEDRHHLTFDTYKESKLTLGRVRLGLCAGLGVLERPREIAGISNF